jgi:STE24 endopeptidase
MQLALIFQLSIALLAGELAGTSGIGAWTGAAVALAGPVVVLGIGRALVARAERSMDAMQSGGPERFFAFQSKGPWLAALCMAVAASSELPRAAPGAFGAAAATIYLFACGIAAILAGHWNAWRLESRIREATIIRTLDEARPLCPMPSRPAYVLAQARAGLLPLLAPLVIPVALSEVGRMVAAAYFPGDESLGQFAGALAGIAVVFLSVPILMPPILGLVRLAPGPLRDDLESLARSAGIGVREIWVWPTDGLVANAAVIGVLPRLRCVMLSDALLECMPREQVLAVMAHELGHVMRRHLLWLLPVILACWALAGLVAAPLAEWAYHALAPEVGEGSRESLVGALVLARDASVLVLGLAAFGYASRRFERQADADAVRLLSERAGSGETTPAAVAAMSGALASVAFLNRVPPERPSWRHGSIAWRRRYLAQLVGVPLGPLAFDRFVGLLGWSSVVVVLAAILWNWSAAA